MKRLAAALAALCIATSPALAARVLVVKQTGALGNAPVPAAAFRLATVENVLKTLGCDYDVVSQHTVRSCATCPPQNTNQRALRTGRVGMAVDSTAVFEYAKQYGLIIHLGWFAGGGSQRMTGYNPDTLTRPNVWSSIPQIFMGPDANPGGSAFAQTATCSSGVASTVSITNVVASDYRLSYYTVDAPYVWKGNKDGGVYYMNGANQAIILGDNAGTVVLGDGTVSTVLQKARVVAGTTPVAYRTNGLTSCTTGDCDSVGRSLSYFRGASPLSDTAIVWTRERFAGDSAIQVFVPATYFVGGVLTGPEWLAMAVAMADSAALNKTVGREDAQVIGKVAGWKPRKFAFVVEGAFSRGESSSSHLEEFDEHSIQVSDSVLIKSTIDSLAALGIPITIGVNVDSVASYPYEKAWWNRLGRARYYPSARMQTGSFTDNVPSYGNAGRYASPDLWGYRRSRNLISSDRYDNGTPCLDVNGVMVDTTLSCMLAMARARLDSIPEFRGKMSSTIIAPSFDYIPAGRVRARLPSLDSLEKAMLLSGYNTAIVNVMQMGSMPGASWALNAGSSYVPTAADPKSFGGTPIKSRNGFKWLTTRQTDEGATRAVGWPSHQIADEAMVGLFGSPWYPAELLNYYHQFTAPLNVYTIKAGDFGYTATGANAVRPGWYDIKWIVNRIRAINHYAGRQVIHITYPEDIEL